MTNVSASVDIISQDQYNEYTAKWLGVVSEPGSSELAQAFLANGNDRLLYVSLPVQRVMGLVSAVGVQTIKVRFLLVPGASDGKQHFCVALFATDGKEEAERLSAYYLANQYWTLNTPSPELGEPVPQTLADTWIANWKGASGVVPGQFATSYGPLQGYNFNLKDFVTPLFGADPLSNQEFRLYFGLHEYYSATNDKSLTQTFGLILQLYSPGQATIVGGGDPYFDMAAPSPPNT